MSFDALLRNSVVIEKRTTTPGSTGEEVESYPIEAWSDPIPASVQDRTDQQLALPDVDGPVLINAVIFTGYRTDIRHLDVLRQVDITPARRYLVQHPKDPAGLHHHLEHQCQRIETVVEAGS